MIFNSSNSLWLFETSNKNRASTAVKFLQSSPTVKWTQSFVGNEVGVIEGAKLGWSVGRFVGIPRGDVVGAYKTKQNKIERLKKKI